MPWIFLQRIPCLFSVYQVSWELCYLLVRNLVYIYTHARTYMQLKKSSSWSRQIDFLIPLCLITCWDSIISTFELVNNYIQFMNGWWLSWNMSLSILTNTLNRWCSICQIVKRTNSVERDLAVFLHFLLFTIWYRRFPVY